MISNPTDAVWNRVKCVPFVVKLSNEEIDTDFHTKLEAELPGILAWVVEGAQEYHRVGLRQCPPEVEAATAEYQADSDRLKEFIEDCCDMRPHAWVSTEHLVKAYNGWCDQNGVKDPMGSRAFLDQIQAKGCRLDRKNIMRKVTRGWSGICLKTDGLGEG